MFHIVCAQRLATLRLQPRADYQEFIWPSNTLFGYKCMVGALDVQDACSSFSRERKKAVKDQQQIARDAKRDAREAAKQAPVSDSSSAYNSGSDSDHPRLPESHFKNIREDKKRSTVPAMGDGFGAIDEAHILPEGTKRPK